MKSFAILVLMTGLVYPYIHLSLHPHRYCPYHHSFEPITPDEENGPTHNPGPGAPHHKKCPFAKMLGAVAITGPTISVPVYIQPMVIKNLPLFENNTYKKSAVLLLAPKQSPPALFS